MHYPPAPRGPGRLLFFAEPPYALCQNSMLSAFPPAQNALFALYNVRRCAKMRLFVVQGESAAPSRRAVGKKSRRSMGCNPSGENAKDSATFRAGPLFLLIFCSFPTISFSFAEVRTSNTTFRRSAALPAARPPLLILDRARSRRSLRIPQQN